MNRARTFCASLALITCAAAQADEVADRAAIERTAREWTAAFNARDAARMLAVSTPDIVLMDAHSLAGRDALQPALDAAFNRRTRLENQTKEIAVVGATAWRTASLTISVHGTVSTQSPALEIWQRIDGMWKLHRHMSGALRPPVVRPQKSEPRLDSVTQ